MLYRKVLLDPLIRISKSDPERAHEWINRSVSPITRLSPLLNALARAKGDDTLLRQDLMGMKFDGVVGLAAGFDKQAHMTAVMQQVFDFVEIGTVLCDVQQGNPRPRIIRITAEDSLINRMGFNSEGANAVLNNLSRQKLSDSVPVFANISKLKETPLEEAVNEYVELTKKLGPTVRGLVVNVSSPNTPNLRKLVAPEYLEPLVKAVQAAAGEVDRPVMYKFDPDMDDGMLKECIDVILRGGAKGIVLGNTSLQRPGASAHLDEMGGYSGPHLYDRTLQMVKLAAELVPSDFVIVGCGGINSVDRACSVLSEGANLIEIYTGFIYKGPLLPRRLNKGIAARLKQKGLSNVSQLHGRK